MPLMLGLVAGNIASGQLVSRIGRYKPIMLISIAALVVSYVWMATTTDVGATSNGMIVRMAILGLAMGPALPLYTLAIQNGMPARDTGAVTAATTFFRQIGSTVGIATMGAVFGAALAPGMAKAAMADGASVTMALSREAIAHATRMVFAVGAGLTALAFVATLGLPELPLRKTNR